MRITTSATAAGRGGKPEVEKVERRRRDRLREVLGIEGLAAELPEDEALPGPDLPPTR